MRKHKDAMTLLEVIIALGLTALIFAVIYPFFFSNNKILSSADIKSTLQSEGKIIEEKISNIGMQAIGIKGLVVNGSSYISVNNNNTLIGKATYKQLKSNEIINSENEIMIDEISLDSYDKDENIIRYKFIFDKNNKMLKLAYENEEITLSENVESFKIKPVVTDDELTLEKSNSVEFIIDLTKKKGYSNSEYTVLTIINFRNK